MQPRAEDRGLQNEVERLEAGERLEVADADLGDVGDLAQAVGSERGDGNHGFGLPQGLAGTSRIVDVVLRLDSPQQVGLERRVQHLTGIQARGRLGAARTAMRHCAGQPGAAGGYRDV